MRTFAVACGVALLGAVPARAQVPGLGVKAGINLATQRNAGEGEGSDTLKTLTALVAGAFATFPLTSWLEFQPEALYSVKGAKANVEGVDARVLVDYLEVPALARFSRGNYYVAGGPSVALQLRARTRTKFGSATEEIDISDQIERLDFGVAVGGGVEIGSLVVDGRYTHGLRDIDKDRNDSLKVTNRAVSVTVGFRF